VAITEIGTPHQSAGWSTSVSDTHGITIAAGDVVVCYVSYVGNTTCADNNGAYPLTNDLNGSAISTSSAWYNFFTRTAGASEPASYAFTLSGGNTNWWIVTRVFRGVDNANHWDIISNNYASSAFAFTTRAAASITTNYAGSLAIAHYYINTNTQTFSGVDNSFGSGIVRSAAWPTCATYTKTITNVGAVGVTTATYGPTTDDWSGGGMVALRMYAPGFTGLTVIRDVHA